MAAANLLTLIDDIATLLDDVAVLTKVATQKTAGVLGDDLALNAEQVTGVRADRELPVVWAVAKGSLMNKGILVPAALAISYFLPILITPLLMIGGAYLCFEGVEKLAHKYLHKNNKEDEHKALVNAVANNDVDMVEFEKKKVKGAIRTDFILSAEIIAITLGAVASQPIHMQFAVLVAVSLLITVGVYGIVAGIVKLDDLGIWLQKKPGETLWPAVQRRIGRALLRLAPYLMKTLSIAGTVAMFLVGGGIIVHGIAPLHHLIEAMVHHIASPTGISALELITSMLSEAIVGIIIGAIVLFIVNIAQKRKPSGAH
ncbi:DUF808 domain-containing protein [Marinibactrum halimedae]|uniref:Membrane protein n=1 Tax=Marinibactrum halimedae TaxID=1444977 RepID=A0AA37WPY7_9GAMM|nr:DUF808 domain-containing protein [Marinibactrum halimedae]MCD9460360.1 DUF808 domain-containing protein [Marinibactrum halimedae]GLS26797.1 membrane protein [Marinibactrum halimedae]